MAELHYERRKFRCAVCGKSHDEWYEVEKELIVQVVNRWRTWNNVAGAFRFTFLAYAVLALEGVKTAEGAQRRAMG
jgi:hypothetical protein